MSKKKLSNKARMILRKKVDEKNRKSKNNRLFTILLASIIVVGIAIITVVFIPWGEGAKTNSIELSQKAIDFTLPDTEGNTYSLSDFAGKPILLDFTASWCKWCHVQAPELNRLYNDYRNEVTVLSINTGESADVARSNKQEMNADWKFLVDRDQSVMRNYKVQGIPYLILLKPNGEKYIDQSGYREDFYGNFSSAVKELR